jgi:hypothetical protein
LVGYVEILHNTDTTHISEGIFYYGQHQCVLATSSRRTDEVVADTLAYDTLVNDTDQRHFMLRGVLIWTVSDFLAYGLISGQQTKGYHSCPCCGPLINAKKIRGPIGDKIIYLGNNYYQVMST